MLIRKNKVAAVLIANAILVTAAKVAVARGANRSALRGCKIESRDLAAENFSAVQARIAELKGIARIWRVLRRTPSSCQS